MEEIVTRESGYLVVFEPASGSTSVDRHKTLKDIAHWLIDEHDTFPSHDMIQDIKEITASGGVAAVDLTDLSATLYVALSAPEQEQPA